ncbi:DHA14-like major facilitator [Mycena sanguinolenta]|uniref:DHA14-like major facilitator n=1 Tax=Mycena sanguinolenta TaxID=230812 RepID=A0A8H7D994_9AGAR|nr:DHA14-like major facilitator [Mycena sanguinolenta]
MLAFFLASSFLFPPYAADFLLFLPGALVIVANTVPLNKRPLYTGMAGGMGGIGSVAGPILGGVITEKLSFRFCFYLSLPFGMITLALVIFLLKLPGTTATKLENTTFLKRLAYFDPFGTLVFIPAVVCLLLALQFGGSKYPWNSGFIIGLLIAFSVLISIFIRIQLWTQEKATVPPRILKRRSIWSSSLFAFSMGGAFIIVTFYLPIWFQVIRGVSAVRSGIDTLVRVLIIHRPAIDATQPVILSLVVGSVAAGVLITIVGYYAPFMVLSSIFTVVGTGMLAALTVTSNTVNWLPFEILCGFGVGLGMQQPMLAAQTVLDLKDVPIGTALVMFANTLGGALFVSIAQNVFTNRLVTGLIATVPDVSPSFVLSAGADSLKNSVAPEFLPGVLSAYNQALTTTFYVAMALGGVSVVGAFAVEWLSVKGKNTDMMLPA